MDVSDRRSADAERAAPLERERLARAEAEQANRIKDDFLGTLSHELRTPLSSLLLSSQLLRRGRLEEPRLRKTAEAIERAAKAQARLIDDLLDISRIASGKLRMELRAVSLAAVVRGAAESVAPMAERKQIALELRIDDAMRPVSGDAARLQQVIGNLLQNAIQALGIPFSILARRENAPSDPIEGDSDSDAE
jgi:signal transduction histidine kinase